MAISFAILQNVQSRSVIFLRAEAAVEYMTNVIMYPSLTREESGELEDSYMGSKKICRWYDETSGVKRACDLGLIEKKWVEEYCWKSGAGCVRKKRFEEEGYVSPDYVLPNGAVSERIKNYLESKGSS